MGKLAEYDPLVVGSIPLAIDVPGSDLDIICKYDNKEGFIADLSEKFSKQESFNIYSSQIYGNPTVTADFVLEKVPFQIFGQEIPTKMQMGFRHLLIEQKILLDKDENFKAQIIALKKSGLKTEPAFCRLLGFAGNPYLEILKLET